MDAGKKWKDYRKQTAETHIEARGATSSKSDTGVLGVEVRRGFL